MLFPEGVFIDSGSGHMDVATGKYTKRLTEISSLFQDSEEAQRLAEENGDPVVYEVIEYRKDGSDILFGTTTMFPGDVAGEYYMTRGHYHQRRDMGEVYYTQSGQGVLLLESRDGESRVVEMKPGVCAFIPPDWAHRSINTGPEKLVFVWVCNVEAGHDYGEILSRGMKKVATRRDGDVKVIDNPRHS